MIERKGLRAVIAEPDPYEQMRLWTPLVTGIGERTSALWLALRGAAEIDEEARQLYERWEAQRLESMRTNPVPNLVAKGVLRPDVTPDEAAAILWVLTDPALFHRLVVQAGWTPERFDSWLYDTILSQLLIPRAQHGDN